MLLTSHRRTSKRRPSRIVRAATAGALALAATVALPAIETLAGGAGPLSCATADAQTQVRVGMVIDFGTLPGAPVHLDRRECVALAPGRSGFDALKAGGHTFRIESSGLLCAIDGYPSTGCGEQTPTGYRFWAYFSGDGNGGWTYSGVGPGTRRLQNGSVEGWHFVEGAANPNDPPPDGTSHSADICPPIAVPTTPPPPPPTTPPTPAPTPGPTLTPPTTGLPGAPSTTALAPGPGSPDPRAASAGGAGDPTDGPDGTAPALDGAVGPEGTVVTASATPSADSPSGRSDSNAVQEQAGEVLDGLEPTSSDGSAPPILAVGIVLLLAGAAAWQFRFRRTA